MSFQIFNQQSYNQYHYAHIHFQQQASMGTEFEDDMRKRKSK